MENNLILLFLILALIVIFNLLIKKLKLSKQISNRKIIGNVYENKKFLFTPAEKSFLSVLDDIFEQGFRIFGQVRLADVIKVKPGSPSSERQSAFNRIRSKHLDFVVCNENDLSIVGAIELDDRSHNRPGRIKRDTFLNQALESASVPLFRHPVKKRYDIDDLREKLSDVFGIDLAINSDIPNSSKNQADDTVNYDDADEPYSLDSSFKL